MCGCETQPLPVSQDQVPVTLEIMLVYFCFTVPCAVVFVDSASALDQQIGTRHKATVLIKDFMLWLDRDIRCYV